MSQGTKFCKHCCQIIDSDCVVCPKCGKQVENLNSYGGNANGPIIINNNGGYNNVVSPKSWLVTLLLCLFVDVFGIHRFYAGKRFYQRNDYSISFVVKKEFADGSDEAIAIIKADSESEISPIEQIHSKVEKICTSVRKEHKTDGTTDIMDVLTKMPVPILSFIMNTLSWLDFHGWYPDSLMKEDPYFSSIFVSNLGSIKMNASYHHLANWGTNSFFVIVGEKKPTPFFSLDGSFEVREALELGVTLDERIADGYYYSRSIKLIHKLLDEPELLDRPIYEPVDF